MTLTEFIAEQTTGPAVDKMALKQLTDMGFSEDKATKALKLNRLETFEYHHLAMYFCLFSYDSVVLIVFRQTGCHLHNQFSGYWIIWMTSVLKKWRMRPTRCRQYTAQIPKNLQKVGNYQK